MAFNELDAKAKVKEIKFDTVKNGQLSNMRELSKAENEIKRLHKVFKEIILSPQKNTRFKRKASARRTAESKKGF